MQRNFKERKLIMSATQLQASERFIDAMGPMITDAKAMNQVITYISLLRHQAEPCQHTTDEMREMLAASISDVRAGRGTTHAELKKEIAQWL